MTGSGAAQPAADLFRLSVRLLSVLFESPVRTFSILLPYGCATAVFAAFLVLNGGIAIGDRDRHVPVVHLAQGLYAVTFAAIFLSPVALRPRSICELFEAIRTRPFRCASKAERAELFSFVLATCGIALVVHRFTCVT